MKLKAVCGESFMHGLAGEVSGGNTSIDSNNQEPKQIWHTGANGETARLNTTAKSVLRPIGNLK